MDWREISAVARWTLVILCLLAAVGIVLFTIYWFLPGYLDP